MARSYTDSKFSRIVNVEGKEGDFWLVRKADKNSRVLQINKEGDGEVVATARLLNEREYKEPTPETPATPATETPVSESTPAPEVASAVVIENPAVTEEVLEPASV